MLAALTLDTASNATMNDLITRFIFVVVSIVVDSLYIVVEEICRIG